ncbi:MAG: hypothetical protein LBM38_03605 [Clostridiales bacterium]|nr:hypothetical protein [Clostridiales bacterium]
MPTPIEQLNNPRLVSRIKSYGIDFFEQFTEYKSTEIYKQRTEDFIVTESRDYKALSEAMANLGLYFADIKEMRDKAEGKTSILELDIQSMTKFKLRDKGIYTLEQLSEMNSSDFYFESRSENNFFTQKAGLENFEKAMAALGFEFKDRREFKEKNQDKTPIDELNLHAKTIKYLKSFNINTIEDLAASHSYDYGKGSDRFLEPSTFNNIRVAMQEKGFYFLDEKYALENEQTPISALKLRMPTPKTLFEAGILSCEQLASKNSYDIFAVDGDSKNIIKHQVTFHNLKRQMEDNGFYFKDTLEIKNKVGDGKSIELLDINVELKRRLHVNDIFTCEQLSQMHISDVYGNSRRKRAIIERKASIDKLRSALAEQGFYFIDDRLTLKAKEVGTPIDELNLNKRVNSVLKENGILTIEQLSAMNFTDLYGQKDNKPSMFIAKSTVDGILKALNKRGLSFVEVAKEEKIRETGTSIEELDCSVKMKRSLAANDILTLEQLSKYKTSDIFGKNKIISIKKSLVSLKEAMRKLGFCFADETLTKISEDSIENLHLTFKTEQKLKQNNITSIKQLSELELPQLYIKKNGANNIVYGREVVEQIADKLSLYGYGDSPLVKSAESTKGQLYTQLAEMHQLNQIPNTKIPSEDVFIKQPVETCLKQVFFYRDYCFKAPLDNNGQEQVYSIVLPRMNVSGDLSGLYISEFAVGIEADGGSKMNYVNLKDSGVTIDLSSISPPYKGSKGDVAIYDLNFGKVDFNGCNCIGRLPQGHVAAENGYQSAKFEIKNLENHLPAEYLTRRARFHNAGVESSESLAKRLADGVPLKNARVSESTNLIDFDLSKIGTYFEGENENWLKQKHIIYSLRGEMHKAKWRGESIYLAERGMQGFEFDRQAVAENLRASAKIRNRLNPTIKGYEFLAAQAAGDYKYLAETFIKNIELNDNSAWFSQNFKMSKVDYIEVLEPNKEYSQDAWAKRPNDEVNAIVRYGFTPEQVQIITQNTPDKIFEKWQEQEAKCQTRIALQGINNVSKDSQPQASQLEKASVLLRANV